MVAHAMGAVTRWALVVVGWALAGSAPNGFLVTFWPP